MITLCKSKGLAQDVTRRFSSAGRHSSGLELGKGNDPSTSDCAP
jgi:hypothetical protein